MFCGGYNILLDYWYDSDRIHKAPLKIRSLSENITWEAKPGFGLVFCAYIILTGRNLKYNYQFKGVQWTASPSTVMFYDHNHGH